jgi:hypothetical protein
MLEKSEVTFATLKYDDFRIVKPNESYYQMYDSTKSSDIPVDYGHPSTPYEYS